MMDEVPISLYLRLEQGQHADLSTVSRAALSFAEIIQEFASELFPDAEVRVEAVDAVDGSFGWNTITKIFIDAKAGILAGARKHPKPAYLAAYVALRVLNNGIDWTQDQVMDWLAGNDSPAECRTMSATERSALASDIVGKLNSRVAERPTDTLYRDVQRDRKVEGVGVTVRPSARPALIVPRTRFIIERATSVSLGETRTSSQRVQATLISPVLAPGDRRWKFRTATGEFGAPVRDGAFLDRVLSGRTDMRLKSGLTLDMQLEVTETYEDGAWAPTSRVVTEVYGWRNAPEQGELLGPRSGDV